MLVGEIELVVTKGQVELGGDGSAPARGGGTRMRIHDEPGLARGVAVHHAATGNVLVLAV